MNDESRPKAAHESAETDLTLTRGSASANTFCRAGCGAIVVRLNRKQRRLLGVNTVISHSDDCPFALRRVGRMRSPLRGA